MSDAVPAVLAAEPDPFHPLPADADKPVAPALAQQVIDWQRQHGRHGLPWQNTRDPYRVWLSEIMLQQTQVSTVLTYYERFLERFPDVAALAAAPLDDVLALWSGLGYYSRARNLHRCAQQVMTVHGGAFPANSLTLATLPGIGRSTASAIAAFCFGERAAILDGNVKRVLTRALGFGEDLAVQANERALWQRAEALLPDRDMDAYTQGLMDLGATVCTLRRPQCLLCPLQDGCVARQLGAPERFPVKTRKLVRKRRENVLLWLVKGDALWLEQRPAPGVWAGLWCWPMVDSIDALEAQVKNWPGEGEWLLPFQHALTHFDWLLQPWRHHLPAALPAAVSQTLSPNGRWVSLDQALQLGLPAPVRKLLLSAA